MIRVNLLGVPRARRRRVRAPAITMEGSRPLILLVVVLVAVAGLQYWRYNRLKTEGANLDRQVQELQREKAELAQVQSQYETFSRRKELLEARIAVIEQLKAQQSGPVTLLNTVASAVSATDSLWLTGLEKTGERVSITGVALNMRAVADFMTRLKNSNTFREVDLRETVQDASKDIESFNFTVDVQIAPPAPPPSTPSSA